MIIDKDHLPIEILVRKCLAHRFIERHEVIRLVEGGNDETEKRRRARVANHELVPSFYCVMNFYAVTVLRLSIAAWRWPQAFDCRGGASASVVGRRPLGLHRKQRRPHTSPVGARAQSPAWS